MWCIILFAYVLWSKAHTLLFTLRITTVTGAGPSSYHPMPPPGEYEGASSYPPPPPPPTQGTYNNLYGIAFTY